MATLPTAADTGSAATRPPLNGWLAVLAVMMGIFAIVTTEILPIGLLTPIGRTFGISAGTAGLTMTVPGILAALAAPAMTVATASLDRRRVLCALMVVLAVADLLAATAPAYWVMVVSRVLVGVVIGAFWSVGAGLAARLVPDRHAGRATTVIFAAVPLGSVLGVPAGTFLGTLAGWRAAFVVMGLLTVGVVVALLVFLPALPPQTPTRLSVLRTVLRGSATRVGLLVTLLVVSAHFGTYTYVTPFLEDVTRAAPASITAYLLVYGAAGLAGNFAGGLAVARAPSGTFCVAAAALAAATMLLPVFGRTDVGAVALLVVWGLAYGAVPVCSQTWFVTAAPHAPEAATVLFTSSFQATIALGALLGGVVVDAASTSAVMVAGGTVALLVPLALGLFRLRGPAHP
ncbi:MFS transporter [Pseudonocardia sp. MH-G8]|uniref:MFS transporter n=1 Tax=Pseudonocardia sp. MH-G8 TaxID=1854588 RepID=UPI000BA0A686|nr:MFS transporter [Pseudonocardia sp. MH-G8]OZM82858.1 MFS transporter [Pseudonocardia sp. MH-G8]